MKRRLSTLTILLVVVLLVLAACGGDDDGTDSSNNGDDNASNTANTNTSTRNGPVNFTIAGDPVIDREVSGASAATDVTNNLVSLLFFVSLSDLVVDIGNIPYDQAPGTYDIQTTMDFGSIYAEAVNAAAGYRSYSSTGGTLEITKWDDSTMSGTFEFTAEKEVDEGEDPVTVTVSGTFTDIPAPKPVE